MLGKDKAIKFNTTKAPARYFYWDCYDILYPNAPQLGQNLMDGLIKNLFDISQYDFALSKLRHIATRLCNSFTIEEQSDIDIGVTRASEQGALHYGHFNYQKGFNWSEVVDALGRHMVRYLRGQVLDKDSGLDHRYHMLANIYMLAYHIDKNVGVNDFLVKREETKDEDS